MLELVVVITVSMILLFLGFQFSSAVQRIAARAELALLAVTICTEQQTALLTDTQRVITFDAHGLGYATQTRSHTFQRGIVLGVPPRGVGSPSDPHKEITNPVTFIDNKLVCYPHGTVQAGTVYLAAPAYNQYYALTSAVSRYSFLRLYQHRLTWIPL